MNKRPLFCWCQIDLPCVSPEPVLVKKSVCIQKADQTDRFNLTGSWTTSSVSAYSTRHPTELPLWTCSIPAPNEFLSLHCTVDSPQRVLANHCHVFCQSRFSFTAILSDQFKLATCIHAPEVLSRMMARIEGAMMSEAEQGITEAKFRSLCNRNARCESMFSCG